MIFQAKTQAEIFLLNRPPRSSNTGNDGARAVTGRRASDRAVSIESFYSDEVEDADDDDAGTGATPMLW